MKIMALALLTLSISLNGTSYDTFKKILMSTDVQRMHKWIVQPSNSLTKEQQQEVLELVTRSIRQSRAGSSYGMRDYMRMTFDGTVGLINAGLVLHLINCARTEEDISESLSAAICASVPALLACYAMHDCYNVMKHPRKKRELLKWLAMKSYLEQIKIQ